MNDKTGNGKIYCSFNDHRCRFKSTFPLHFFDSYSQLLTDGSLFTVFFSLDCWRRRLTRFLSRLTCHHTAASYRFEELLDFGSTVDKLVGPELERRVLDQFDERDQQSPGVRPVDNESLQQNPGDLLLDGLRVGLCEQVEQAA